MEPDQANWQSGSGTKTMTATMTCHEESGMVYFEAGNFHWEGDPQQAGQMFMRMAQYGIGQETSPE